MAFLSLAAAAIGAIVGSLCRRALVPSELKSHFTEGNGRDHIVHRGGAVGTTTQTPHASKTAAARCCSFRMKRAQQTTHATARVSN